MLGRVLYFVFPVGLLFLPYVFHIACDDTGFYFAKESGAVEIITAVLLAVAIGVVAAFLVQLIAMPTQSQPLNYRKLTIAWCIIYCLGCIYFLGEEISWGQHLFGWATPEAWMEVNDQGETNLHNTSGWLDQVPRNVLTFGIVVGGFIFPMAQRKRPLNPDSFIGSFLVHFMPGWNCLCAGACVVLRELLVIIAKASGIKALSIADGEVKESLIALFLLVYIVDLFQRTTQENPPIADAKTADVAKQPT